MRFKKIVMVEILISCIIILPGCTTNKLDMKKIKEIVPNITTETTLLGDINNVFLEKGKGIFNDSSILSKQETVDFFHLDLEIIDDASVMVNDDNSIMFALVIPKKDKKELAFKKMNTYFQKKKLNEKENKAFNEVVFFEKGNVLCYIISPNALEIKNIILSTEVPLFNMIVSLTNDNLNYETGINADLLEEFTVYVPMNIEKSTSLFMVLKPFKGEEVKVKKTADNYFLKLEDAILNKSSLQYNIIKDKHFEKYEDYLIYVASSNNEKVVEIIKKAI